MRRSLNVIMDITSRCNLKCRMCYFSAIDQLLYPPFDQPPEEVALLPLAHFEHVANQLFGRARKVALGCSAEPLLHPQLAQILAIASRYQVPELWFPTNLLTLTRSKAEAIVSAPVHTVAVSIDGVCAETYELIRTGASWKRLHDRLELLRVVRAKASSRLPRLRVIFTWMQSNRAELTRLPAFAAAIGAAELDVRFVTPTTGVDQSQELLDNEDPLAIRAELEATAADAVRRGLRLAAFPHLPPPDGPRSLLARLRRRLWLLRAGLDGPQRWLHARRQRRHGCAYPGTTYLVRPNGTVLPCPFWESEAIARIPGDDHAAIAGSPLLYRIRSALADGEGIGSCIGCPQRRNAFYQPPR